MPGVMAGEVRTVTGHGRTAFIDADDIAAVACAVLGSANHSEAIYDITGPEAMSFPEALSIISDVAGRQIAYSQIPEAELVSLLAGFGLPRDYAVMIVRDQAAIRDDYGAVVTDTVRKVTGRQPLSFRDYAVTTAPAWTKA